MVQKFSLKELEAGKVELPGRSGTGIFSAARQMAKELLKNTGEAVLLSELVGALKDKFKDKDGQQVYSQARAALTSFNGIKLKKMQGRAFVVKA